LERDPERDDDGAEPNLIAIDERDRLAHGLAFEERAVLAAQIFDGRLLTQEQHARVVARHPWGIDPDGGIPCAPEDVLALGQRNLSVKSSNR
jgi:hypothetical protein